MDSESNCEHFLEHSVLHDRRLTDITKMGERPSHRSGKLGEE